ncbi:MAG: PLP-dependent aminotransferase family protein [Thermoleophilaceae bacterium]
MDTPPKPPTRSTSRDLERYAGLFAARTRGMTSSAMRDMMAITQRPEVISLAGGLPDTSTFPPETLAAVTARIAQESSAKALQYGPTDGLIETKRCIAEVMAAEGMRVDLDDVVVTTGGQQVIDLVVKTLIDPGDVIIAEGPTYPGAVPVFNAYQADVVQLDVDDQGMRVDLLEQTIDALEAEGRRLKFIYTVPTFQNPGGATMSLARRHELVRIATERELLVLEDNPYGLLRYEGEPLPPLYKLDGGVYVMYLGTFSKILSPGIRLGWVAAPPPVLEKINLGKQEADLCTSTLSQLMVQAYFERGEWQDYVESLIGVYRPRRDAMLDALREHFPAGAAWTRPAGGMFVWVTLPDYTDTTDMLARALRDNVAFVPGEGAFLDGRGRDSMRLNFSGSTSAEIREGIRRIGAVIAEQVALYGTLTGEVQAVTPDDTEAARREPDAETGARVVELRRHSEERRRAGGR